PNANRAALLLALGGAMQEASSLQEDRRHGQRSIFDIFEAEEAPNGAPADRGPRALPTIDPWDAKNKLMFEKEALGFYLSSHPLAQHEHELTYASHKVSDIERLAAGAEVMIGGMISALRYTNAKRAYNGDTRMARFNFEDLTGTLECVMFPRDFSQSREEV